MVGVWRLQCPLQWRRADAHAHRYYCIRQRRPALPFTRTPPLPLTPLPPSTHPRPFTSTPSLVPLPLAPPPSLILPVTLLCRLPFPPKHPSVPTMTLSSLCSNPTPSCNCPNLSLPPPPPLPTSRPSRSRRRTAIPIPAPSLSPTIPNLRMRSVPPSNSIPNSNQTLETPPSPYPFLILSLSYPCLGPCPYPFLLQTPPSSAASWTTPPRAISTRTPSLARACRASSARPTAPPWVPPSTASRATRATAPRAEPSANTDLYRHSHTISPLPPLPYLNSLPLLLSDVPEIGECGRLQYSVRRQPQ